MLLFFKKPALPTAGYISKTSTWCWIGMATSSLRKPATVRRNTSPTTRKASSPTCSPARGWVAPPPANSSPALPTTPWAGAWPNVCGRRRHCEPSRQMGQTRPPAACRRQASTRPRALSPIPALTCGKATGCCKRSLARRPAAAKTTASGAPTCSSPTASSPCFALTKSRAGKKNN